MKILFQILILLRGLLSLNWFFNPHLPKENELSSGIIDIHKRLFDDHYFLQKHKSESKNNVQKSEVSESRSLSGRSLNFQQYEPNNSSKSARQLSFRLRPFDSLSRNIKFRGPSNTFRKKRHLPYTHKYALHFFLLI